MATRPERESLSVKSLVEGLDVGDTDACRLDPHQHLALANLAEVEVFQADGLHPRITAAWVAVIVLSFNLYAGLGITAGRWGG